MTHKKTNDKERKKKDFVWIWICPNCGRDAGKVTFGHDVEVKVANKKTKKPPRIKH